jgi:hypothetical protein
MSYAKYEGRKVVVVYKVDGQTDAVEQEGLAEVANEGGILFKPKGKTQMILLEAANIEEVNFIEDKPKKLDRKTLKLVLFGNARSHLLERHGYRLGDVNDMSEQDAYDLHEGIDHDAEDLGHVHKDKSDTARAEAVESDDED